MNYRLIQKYAYCIHAAVCMLSHTYCMHAVCIRMQTNYIHLYAFNCLHTVYKHMYTYIWANIIPYVCMLMITYILQTNDNCLHTDCIHIFVRDIIRLKQLQKFINSTQIVRGKCSLKIFNCLHKYPVKKVKVQHYTIKCTSRKSWKLVALPNTINLLMQG